MPVLSKHDIETLSRKILRKYLTTFVQSPTRINPVDFSEKMCGLHFVVADLSYINLLGITSFGNIEFKIPIKNDLMQPLVLDGKTAYIDKSLINSKNLGRANFTMMHETAHHLLSQYFPCDYNVTFQPFICRLANERTQSPIMDWTEWQANMLASCLLLPRELVHKTMWQVCMCDRIIWISAALWIEIFWAGLHGVFSQEKASSFKRLQRLVDQEPYCLVMLHLAE